MSITTTKNFRVEDITHEPRKQMEGVTESTMSTTKGPIPVTPKIRGFQPVSQESINKLMAKVIEENLKDVYVSSEVIMPLRGSKYSAGYDVFSHSDITIAPKGKVLIWTNLKAYMCEGEVLIAAIRSSVGINLDLILSNTVGIIDMDYYNNPKNEGNIGISLRNLSDKEVTIAKNDRVTQLIFLPFLVSDNCNGKADRQGGIGSTGR